MARKTRESHRPRDSFLKLSSSQMRAAEIFTTNDIYDMTISEVALGAPVFKEKEEELLNTVVGA